MRIPDAETLGGLLAQAVDQMIGQAVVATYAAVQATGERDYLEPDDLLRIRIHLAGVLDRWRVPSAGELDRQVEAACRRLGIAVAS